jgi:hypothetical protein
MLAVATTQRSDSDPHDTTSMPIEVDPHWMIMRPFDPKTTRPPSAHKPTGAYIMWAGSPSAICKLCGAPKAQNLVYVLPRAECGISVPFQISSLIQQRGRL